MLVAKIHACFTFLIVWGPPAQLKHNHMVCVDAVIIILNDNLIRGGPSFVKI